MIKVVRILSLPYGSIGANFSKVASGTKPTPLNVSTYPAIENFCKKKMCSVSDVGE